MTKIEQLHQNYLQAKTKEEAESIFESMKRLADENPEEFGLEFLKISQTMLSNLKELNVKLKLEEVSEIISLAYIAEKYFKKSKSWLSQRINENKVNGKPVHFSEEELQTLHFAINDIGKKLGSFSF